MKLKGKHRPVIDVPHRATKFAVCPTGLTFKDCKVALLIPSTSLEEPQQLIGEYIQDMATVFKRAQSITLRDCYEATIRSLEDA